MPEERVFDPAEVVNRDPDRSLDLRETPFWDQIEALAGRAAPICIAAFSRYASWTRCRRTDWDGQGFRHRRAHFSKAECPLSHQQRIKRRRSASRRSPDTLPGRDAGRTGL